LPRSLIKDFDIRFFVHATEDPEKVLDATHSIIPYQYRSKIRFRKRKLKGAYKNPILLYETKINEQEILDSILENMSSNLSSIEKGRLQEEFQKMVDGSKMYLRFDKQESFKGRLILCSGDPIHIRIRFRTKDCSEIQKKIRSFGLIS